MLLCHCDCDCDPGPNHPSGKKVPAAKKKKKQNQAGFWTISATDGNCPGDLSIVVEDTGTEMKFEGPFAEGGTNVQYIRPGTRDEKNPKQKRGSGVVDLKLTGGSGDTMKGIVTDDDAGNIGDPVLCLVPPTIPLLHRVARSVVYRIGRCEKGDGRWEPFTL
jgi:hypothetical protein